MSAESSVSAVEMIADMEGGGVEESVAFSLVEDALKLNEITKDEAIVLREKYRKLQEQVDAAKAQEQYMSRRLRVLEADIISEKIVMEKSRIDEVESTQHVQRAAELRNQLQKELEEVEQKDTMAKFELFELKRVHEELQKSLTAMRKQNNQLVEPVLERLRKETAELTEQMHSTEEAFERESAQKKLVEAKLAEMEALKAERREELKLKTDALHSAEAEPGRLKRTISSIETALSNMEKDLHTLLKRVDHLDKDTLDQARRRAEAEKIRTQVLEKLELNRQTLEERERDVGLVEAKLDKAKAQAHDLVTRKVQVGIQKRDADSHVRHLTDQLALASKDYDAAKRTLKKKRIVLNLVKQNLPGLEGQRKDHELSLQQLRDDVSAKQRELSRLREELDYHVARLLSQEGVEAERKESLERVIGEVDVLETSVVEWLAEGKRQSKLLSVLSAQRDIKARETARIEAKEKDAKLQVHTKELVILDLTKRCNEISNRLKEFSALYEVVKNERNKYVNLIQSSSQALAEMREKIRILHNEVEILSNERAAKDLALTKEHNAHQQAQNQRDALRQDLNRLLSDYRSRQSTVEQQIQEIDKLNVVINGLEKEMLALKTRFERAVEQRNVTGVQLIDRNDELCILYERSNQQQEALRRGEMQSLQKEEELRVLRLHAEELRRQYAAARKRLPELAAVQTELEKLEVELKTERKRTEEVSGKLEDPRNLARWRPLDGEDPDMDQLLARVKILEDQLDRKREQVLEKELVLEEVSSLTEKLRHQALSKREAAKLLADELNDLHGRIRDVTKKMLASVSELSMYQATALRLQQERLQREKALEEAEWRIQHGEAPSASAEQLLYRMERAEAFRDEVAAKRAAELPLLGAPPGSFLRTAAEPRPTAYIPEDLGIPKPYGGMAPFKPSEHGASMRHIRNPVIKPIEI